MYINYRVFQLRIKVIYKFLLLGENRSQSDEKFR